MAKFVLLVTYGDIPVRDATRPAHRDYLKSLLEGGKLIAAGPFLDDSGALIIYEAADLAEAQALLAKDPYTLAGSALATAELREWNRVMAAEPAG